MKRIPNGVQESEFEQRQSPALKFRFLSSIGYLNAFLLAALFFIVTGCSHPVARERPINPRTLPREHPRPKIVIDAGHGGKDFGAASKTTPVALEKTLNLTTALMLNTYLQKMGYQTILTRGADFFVPLDLRAAIANSNDAMLFVSVHYNSAPNVRAEGIEVYYYDSKDNKKRAEESKILANTVLLQILDATKSKSRGIKHGNFAVIRETSMPAILIEGGFITNENEVLRMRSNAYLKTLAESIAIGIDDFLKGNGKKERPRRDSNARPAA